MKLIYNSNKDGLELNSLKNKLDILLNYICLIYVYVYV